MLVLFLHIKCKHKTVPVISKPDNALVQVSTLGPSEESILENDNQVQTTSSTSNVTMRKKKKNMLILKRKEYPTQLSVRHKLSRIEKKE